MGLGWGWGGVEMGLEWEQEWGQGWGWGLDGDEDGMGLGLRWGWGTELRAAPCRKSPVTVKKEEEKKPHIKKPLNAFMLYMKEMRAKVVAECTLKESAAINQILGRRVCVSLVPSAACTLLWRCWGPAGGAGDLQAVLGTCWRCWGPAGSAALCPRALQHSFPSQWHSLSREEQAKYYELARKERQLHSQLYPTWSARDNYVSVTHVPRSLVGLGAEVSGAEDLGMLCCWLMSPALCHHDPSVTVSLCSL